MIFQDVFLFIKTHIQNFKTQNIFYKRRVLCSRHKRYHQDTFWFFKIHWRLENFHKCLERFCLCDILAGYRHTISCTTSETKFAFINVSVCIISCVLTHLKPGFCPHTCVLVHYYVCRYSLKCVRMHYFMCPYALLHVSLSYKHVSLCIITTCVLITHSGIW